jgi:hypothetical protein
MIGSPASKRKGDIYIGFLASESNPPNMIEFLAALHYMNECLLDKVLYAVMDAESSDDYFAETRTHRISMAKIAASIFSPLVEVFEACDRRVITCEETAFRLFDLNPDLRFTLFFLSPAKERNDRAKTIERLATNIAMRLYGFDPRMHKLVAAFYGCEQEQQVVLEGTAKRFAEEDLFGVYFVSTHGIELPGGKTTEEMVFDAIFGKSVLGGVLLSRDIAQYISEHQDYRKQLFAYLSAKLDLTS